MTNTALFAQRELAILSGLSSDPDDRPLIEPFTPEIIALCEKFGQSGQSGGSAPYTAAAIAGALKKLLLQRPICPVTGIDEEWVDIGERDGSTLYQNSRCSPIFKIGDGRSYFLDAIVWRTEKDATWTGSAMRHNGEKVLSRQFIKEFPFTPKTFVIDVIEKEVAKDDWEFYIKDEKQLEEVYEYYDPFMETIN